jgi:phosphoadenosine phosphosulfate reductase
MSALAAGKLRALEDLLAAIARDFAPAALASSLSAEDMVLTDAIFRAGLVIDVFTLDTGRLHGDTRDLVDAIARHYGRAVRVVEPDSEAVAAYVAVHGANAFYGSLELRRRCCALRKVEPLARALQGRRAWLTGLRRGQSATRDAAPLRAFDAVHGLEKFNPLVDWSEDDVWAYVRERGVPYNRLHDQGYRSIGCAPCTRPTVTGEDARAGRWWWEQPASKECGLHLGPEGRLVRAKEETTA